MKTKSDDKLWKYCLEIYRQMYKEASPPADFDELLKTGSCKNRDWFMKYYMPQKRQTEIVNAVCKKYKCSQLDIQRIKKEVYLGSSPNSCRETWLKHIERD